MSSKITLYSSVSLLNLVMDKRKSNLRSNEDYREVKKSIRVYMYNCFLLEIYYSSLYNFENPNVQV
jgi:hypothetical protein